MAEGIPHWEEDDQAWDLLILGTNPMPGVWDIEDGNVKRILDIKKAPGRDGATIKDMGYENGALTLVGQLIGPDEWKKLQSIVSSLRMTQKGKERTAVAISHPKALYLGISQVYITEIQVPRLDNGVMTCQIRVLEFIEKPKASTKKVKTTPSTESEWQKRDFNSVAAAKQLQADEARANQQQALEEAKKQQAEGRWPEFKQNTPAYQPE